MDLHFHTPEIREICRTREAAIAQLGYDGARLLAERLADVEAAETVDDLCDLLGDMILDVSPDEKAINVSHQIQLHFCSAHPQRNRQTPTDWRRTTRLMITKIEKLDG